LADDGGFEVRPDTLCRSLVIEGDRVSAALLEHRPTRTVEHLSTRATVIAADPFRTPQLLWASGIRPQALGRYLMDHPRSNAAIELDAELVPAEPGGRETRARFGSLWVPFADPAHPFQGHVGWTATDDAQPGDDRGVATLSWIGRTWPRPENRVSFSDARSDWCGMPAISIECDLNDTEEREAQWGLRLLESTAAALGRYLPGQEARTAPLGWSLHYQGTVRMGAQRDDTSVCDQRSKVWGFQNLFVGGNGVIPTPTTCNPTLFSVALAAHASPELADVLDRAS
jgi:choline dehydrogenase-like flavoprotein